MTIDPPSHKTLHFEPNGPWFLVSFKRDAGALGHDFHWIYIRFSNGQPSAVFRRLNTNRSILSNEYKRRWLISGGLLQPVAPGCPAQEIAAASAHAS
jgi:hypothetical protein